MLPLPPRKRDFELNTKLRDRNHFGSRSDLIRFDYSLSHFPAIFRFGRVCNSESENLVDLLPKREICQYVKLISSMTSQHLHHIY